uniref:RING-type E3 ubiquitin transferase n=1 Tax=Oryza meridionalis TaxID=40149 RepID=A0A0E0BWA4_9ORYZ
MANDDPRGGGDRPGKQEAGEMVVAPEPEAIAVRIDMAMLHCPICFLPLKPPILQCDAGHMACSNCRGKIAGGRCHSREVVGVGVVYARSRAMEAFVSSTKIQCPYQVHGCRSHVTYYAVDDHQRACPHAPCSCPEPGCGFAGSPPALLVHLAAAHSCHVDNVEYGKALSLRVPASARRRRRRLLVGEEDKRVFLLATATVGAASAVTLVRVAASAETAARYRCKMWANAPAAAASGKADMVMVDMEVASSGAAPGGVAVEEATFLAVPPRMLHGEHKEIILGICIDKKTS